MAETWVHVPEGSPFPLANLPLGIAHDGDQRWRAWAAIGEEAIDLGSAAAEELLASTPVPPESLARPSLNTFLGAGPEAWSALRARLSELLCDRAARSRLQDAVRPQASLTYGVPVAPTDVVDFYSSLHHATNLGRLFRPGSEPLLPNWRHLPVGYHGRASTLLPTGALIVRPSGLRLVDGQPERGPTGALDIELEVGTVVGVGNEVGAPIPIDRAGSHLYGLCLVNDWSARDIQAFEYQPLGPFLGKSFATSVSPWLVPFEALEPFRVPPPEQDPLPDASLRTSERWGFDLELSVTLESRDMRSQGVEAVVISTTSFADMYWTPAQQLSHMTSNGAATRPGDLFASGTVSGATPGSEGSLIELTWRGERPIELPDGTIRTFLEDGDRVVMTGWAGRDRERRIGLGSVSGTVTAGAGGRP